jgi:RNA polymerase sigma factor (sigma-70 family)
MTPTQQLLREFAENDSETAFRQIVDQYVDLVFSTALRRLAGDRHSAEDATQIVFTDLARKAKSLPADVMLGGWLHRHCCFVVSNMRRADFRRATREKESVAMKNLRAEDANWSEVAPELDEAINTLQPEDRDALMLRFFERQDFKAIGEAIGGTENAAQKRVSRALDKLRQMLAQRGVALSVTALMAALASEAIASAPVALAHKASETALKNAAGKATAAAGVTGGLAIAFWALGAAAVIGIVTVAVKTFKPIDSVDRATASQTAQATISKHNVAPAIALNNTAASATTNSSEPADAAAPTGPTLRLTIIAADTGNPVPNVPIDYRASEEGDRWIHKELRASRLGIALIPYSDKTIELTLTAQTEAFADTRLHWETKNSAIPADYTLRLQRGVQIGGKVVNSRGDLIAGATIGFNLSAAKPDLAQKIESHEVGWVQVVAEDGTWQTTRITEPVLRRMFVSARHPDYAGSGPVHAPMLASEVDRLLKGTHVFVLRDGITVRGIVVNKQDEPIAGAKVLVGSIHSSNSREGIANSRGHFEINGCEPGITVVTASAPGYGAKTLRVSSPPADSYRIVLEPGHLLKMRITDKNGQPIPNAYAWLKTMDSDPDKRAPLVQADFDKRSDEEGRIEWDEAPQDELMFDFAARDYMRKVDQKVAADGVEHTITLLSALKISGTVRDAENGRLIPKFYVIAGYPERFIPPGETNSTVHWSDIDRHWVQGSNGRFEKSWEEPIVFGVSESRYIFKIEADGYRPYITRIVNEDEENVAFDVALQSSDTARLTVLDPNGQPAPDVDVAFLRRRSPFATLNGSSLERRNGSDIRSTDANGRVPISDEPVLKIVAAGAPGFVMMNPPDGANPTIHLISWGRVQGKITRRGKPISDWQVHIGGNFQSDGAVMSTTDTQPDADGNYLFDFAPAGQFDLVRMVASGSDRSNTSTRLRNLQIAPGQTTNGDYDDNGLSVQVRLEWPAGFSRSATTKIFCHASTLIPHPPAEEMADPAALARWREQPEIKKLLPTLRYHPLAPSEANPDLWIADDLAPGDWMIAASIIDEKINAVPGQPIQPQFTGLMDIHVPENSSDENFDAGLLVLKTPKIPRPVPQ